LNLATNKLYNKVNDIAYIYVNLEYCKDYNKIHVNVNYYISI